MRSGCFMSWIMVRRIVVRRRWSECVRNKRIILVHTPVHASWLNQVEIYFSIIQRKVLTPNDFATLDAVPSAFGVVRTTEQPNSKAVCVEVHSTRPAELAKACGAALLTQPPLPNARGQDHHDVICRNGPLSNYPKTLSSPAFYGGYTRFRIVT